VLELTLLAVSLIPLLIFNTSSVERRLLLTGGFDPVKRIPTQ